MPVSLEDMQELMAMNERGEYPQSLSEFALEEKPDEVDEVYSNVVGQDSLTRFDEERAPKEPSRIAISAASLIAKGERNRPRLNPREQEGASGKDSPIGKVCVIGQVQ